MAMAAARNEFEEHLCAGACIHATPACMLCTCCPYGGSLQRTVCRPDLGTPDAPSRPAACCIASCVQGCNSSATGVEPVPPQSGGPVGGKHLGDLVLITLKSRTTAPRTLVALPERSMPDCYEAAHRLAHIPTATPETRRLHHGWVASSTCSSRGAVQVGARVAIPIGCQRIAGRNLSRGRHCVVPSVGSTRGAGQAAIGRGAARSGACTGG
eukprot:353226-Chlamydomonas_euryale.AAC.11